MEVFFDSAAGSNISSSQVHRGIKREREEDDNVGLSLDGDDQSPTTLSNSVSRTISTHIKTENSASISASLPSDDHDQDKDGLKRAYDDALAARGLISVSRSSEKLTDLALPAKMQRTISQEYLKSMNAGATPTTFTSFSFNPSPAPAALTHRNENNATSNQHKITHPAQQQFQVQQNSQNLSNTASEMVGSSVEVPATTKCALCDCINVDTQLRPCGCMFHGRCLKPSLQNAMAPPKCPIDNIIMQSAVLAVPTDENSHNLNSVAKNNNYTSSYGTSTTPLTTSNNSKEISNTSSV